MANHFVGAVKEMHARIAMVATAPDPAVIVRAAVQAMYPIALNLVQNNNVALARTFRNNPSLVKPGR